MCDPSSTAWVEATFLSCQLAFPAEASKNLPRFRLEVRTIQQPPLRVDDLLQKHVIFFKKSCSMATSPFFQICHSKNMKIRTTFSLKHLMLMVNAFWIMLSRRNWEGNYGGQKCIETAIWCPTVWIFEIGGTWIFIKDQWQFIYIFIVLILSVSFCYEVPSESACNPHIMKITTISFYAVSASPCQCLIRPVQRFKVSWFLGSFLLVSKLHQRACV